MKGHPPRHLAPSPLGAGILALVVMVQLLASSWLWTLMYDSWFLDKKLYRGAWAGSGFRHLPIDDLATGLNRHLPLDTPIRLGLTLSGQEQWSQRLKEGLYPRRVRDDATLTLDVSRTQTHQVVANGPQGGFFLTGKLPPPPAVPAPGKTDLTLSIGRVLLHAFAAFGWGAAAWLAIARWRGRRRRAPREQPTPAANAGEQPEDGGMPLLAGAGLAAPVFFGFLGTMATVVQRPLPWTVLTAVGVLFAIAVLALQVRRTMADKDLRRPFRWIRHPETWAIVAISAVLVRHLTLWPIIGWDGRSIWLYRAKQIAHNGYVTLADAINPTNFFSHMEYPLLYPSWTAFFGTLGPVREPELAVGAVLLHLGLTACLWFVSRRRLGRLVGAAFVGAIYVLTAASVERGYADGMVSTFLLIMMFALDDAELEPYGWLAFMGASMTKREGLIFAVIAAGLFLLFHPRFRAKRFLPRFLPALMVLPAMAHTVWTQAIGIKDSHAGAKLPATLGLAYDRAWLTFRTIGSMARESPALALGFAVLAAFLALEIAGRRSWLSRMMAGTTVGVVAFSYLAMVMTPYDVAYQVKTAMERVLMHATVSTFAAVLVAMTTREQLHPSEPSPSVSTGRPAAAPPAGAA